jgi:hypothetical protein
MAENGDSFEDTLRSIAGEVSRFIERSVENVDVEQFAESTGVDPVAVRDWIERAGEWLRSNTETLGDELARRVRQTPHGGAGSDPLTQHRAGASDPLRQHRGGDSDPLGGAGPHPLDPPTEEQGLALAGLDSGRLAVEPGTATLDVRGEGPTPRGAWGVVRELRVRDWITPDGELTLAGRYALTRWLEGSGR